MAQMFRNRKEKIAGVAVLCLVVVAIIIPIYISTLKRTDLQDNRSGPTAAHGGGTTNIRTLTTKSLKTSVTPTNFSASTTMKMTTTSTNATTPKANTTTSSNATTTASNITTATITVTTTNTTKNTTTIPPATTTKESTLTSASPTNSTAPYQSNGSLRFQDGEFRLNNIPFRIISGAIHYFRTPPEYWPDRLSKLKARGINTVETYVPWNLHEEYPGKFNFEGLLNVSAFLDLAKSLDLYVIFRPGPYICSEWDFGGLPAWLLSDPDMKVRSNYPRYTHAVERYFGKLLPLIVDYQYSRGGPIIAFQIENEYGSYSANVEHLKFLKNLYIQHGLKELFLTSDNIAGVTTDIFYQHALPTANFQNFTEGEQAFERIKEWSANFPLMVTEFWTGWFDHWGSEHGGLDLEKYSSALEEILKVNASVNLYMFHGGTNFGFMNGANKFEGSTYKPDVTSYDYDALLTEKGDITSKYLKTREMLLEHVYKPKGITSLPDIPENVTATSYGSVHATEYCSFETLLKSLMQTETTKALPMEMLKLHGDYGQNFGYILYRSNVSGNASQLDFEHMPKDRAQIYQDGVEVSGGTMDWKSVSSAVSLTERGNVQPQTLDILVENHGRVNYATEASQILNTERKGIHGNVTVDGKVIDNFRIYPLEFGSDVVNRSDWKTLPDNASVPGLFRASLQVSNDNVSDTFIFMKGWGKGVVFVNGFNIGRYWSIGPQQTLYVPAPLLRSGKNQIVFFEHEKTGEEIVFTDTPILNNNDPSTIKL